MVFKKSKERKITKYTHFLYKTFQVHVQNEPSNMVAICNGGLAYGLTQEHVLEAFTPFGTIKHALLPPGQTVSFVQFDSVESAVAAVESSEPVRLTGGGAAFLAYVDRLPDHDSPTEMFQSPPGLLIFPDFISEAEEEMLLQCLSFGTAVSTLKKRLVIHYGFEFRYTDNRADTKPIEPIPEPFSCLWPRLLEKSGIAFTPNQCTVNRYSPGDGIPSHVDTHSAFTNMILSLSMQSDVVMDWRQERTLRHVLLPRRSLCVMTGESRYGWTHGITPRKSDVVPGWRDGLTLLPRSMRTSATFRATRTGDCLCSFPALCDTAMQGLKDKTGGITESGAARFEETCVHQVYEEIADHFSETRHKPWPNVVKFLNSFDPGSVILDVGCGNGKYLGSRLDTALLGCDRSLALAQLCSTRGFQVFTCDCLTVPIRDCSVDGTISIAVLHHLSTKERRFKGVKELIRVLRPGGRALIYVWARNQEANAKKSSYLKQRKEQKHMVQSEPETSLACAEDVVLPVHTNRTNFQSADMFVPWKKKPGAAGVGESGPTLLRYYHVFEDCELKDMCGRIEEVTCLDYYYDQGNWCIILEKR